MEYSTGLNSSGESSDDVSQVSNEDEQQQQLSSSLAAAGVDDDAYETLVAEIKEVLSELAQDKAMDAFRGGKHFFKNLKNTLNLIIFYRY